MPTAHSRRVPGQLPAAALQHSTVRHSYSSRVRPPCRDTFLGDLWAFKPATGDWKRLDAQAPFAARAHHTCTVVVSGWRPPLACQPALLAWCLLQPSARCCRQLRSAAAGVRVITHLSACTLPPPPAAMHPPAGR